MLDDNYNNCKAEPCCECTGTFTNIMNIMMILLENTFHSLETFAPEKI